MSNLIEKKMETLTLEEIYSRINDFLSQNCLSPSWNAKKDETWEIIIIHRTSSSWPLGQYQPNVDLKLNLDVDSSSSACAISSISSDSDPPVFRQTSRLVNPFSIDDNKRVGFAVNDGKSEKLDAVAASPQQPRLECFIDDDVKVFDGAVREVVDFEDDRNDVHDGNSSEKERTLHTAQKTVFGIDGTINRTRNGGLYIPTKKSVKRRKKGNGKRSGKMTVRLSEPTHQEEKRDPSFEVDGCGGGAAIKKSKAPSVTTLSKKAVVKKLGEKKAAVPVKKSAAVLKQPVVSLKRLDLSITNGLIVEETVMNEMVEMPSNVEDLKMVDCVSAKSEVSTNDCSSETAVLPDSSVDPFLITNYSHKETTASSPVEAVPRKKRGGARRKKKKKYGGRPTLYPELKPNADGVRKCPMCDETFETSPQILRHYRREHKKLFYPCQKCPREFRDPRDLRAHQDQVHNDGTGELKCTQCGMSFHYLASIQNHVRRDHGGQEARVAEDGGDGTDKRKRLKFKCLIAGCAETFERSMDKENHLYTCHAEKIRYCQICKKPSTSERSLYFHIKTVHDNESIHKCKYCVKEFAFEASLSYHMDEEHEDEDIGSKEFLCPEPKCLKR